MRLLQIRGSTCAHAPDRSSMVCRVPLRTAIASTAGEPAVQSERPVEGSMVSGGRRPGARKRSP